MFTFTFLACCRKYGNKSMTVPLPQIISLSMMCRSVGKGSTDAQNFRKSVNASKNVLCSSPEKKKLNYPDIVIVFCIAHEMFVYTS